jgi:hypothetical protein
MREVPRPLAGAIAGLVGGVALVAVGAAARELLRVPTLPEALSEGATFFIPFGLFEFMINTFRSQAKVYLVWGIMAVLALVSAALGLLYARWPTPRLAVGLILGLWAFTLLVVLPGAGFGFLGGDLRAGTLAVLAAYLLAWAAFGIALVLTYWLLVPSSRRRGAAGAALGRTASR